MNKFPYVFSPIKIGNVEVKNRIELSPMVPCFDFTGYVSRDTVEYFRQFAKGGCGIVTIGESSIDYVYAKDHYNQLNLDNDGAIGGLSLLSETIHRYGAKISIEINHSGAGGAAGLTGTGKSPIAPSPVLFNFGGRTVKSVQMTQDMIDTVIDQYASACVRCLRSGFDMIMLHGGHGWLLGQFASPYWNKRMDNYGGSLENRARFANQVLSEIRKRVGNKLAIEYRISAEELVPGGMQLNETIEFIKLIQDKIDLVHVTLGVMGIEPKYGLWMHPTYLPHCYIMPWTEKIKRAVRIPVTGMGSISDLEAADKIIAEGKADVVAMARALLADPELVNKSYFGRIDDIKPCTRCMYCTDWRTGLNNSPVRCAINPVAGREIEYKEIHPAPIRKKVVVIGGGPAGMQAALISSFRGHEVVLYEKEKDLGGALRYAAAPSFKQDMKKYLDWLIRKTTGSAVRLKCPVEATLSMVKSESPDTVIVAVGAEPFLPEIPGIGNDNVVLASDVDSDKVITGGKVVIAGAGMVGCETALYLAKQKKDIVLIDMIEMSDVASDAGFQSQACLINLLNQHNVKFTLGVRLDTITRNGVMVIDKQWNRHSIPADTVVIALGFKPRRELANSFEVLATEFYMIGDCSKPGNLMAAIHSGFNIAVEI